VLTEAFSNAIDVTAGEGGVGVFDVKAIESRA
jgi:hypothetical protein